MNKEIILTPNYENTAKFFAQNLQYHEFDRGAHEPIISFIEQIRYLTQTDLPAVQRVIDSIHIKSDPVSRQAEQQLTEHHENNDLEDRICPSCGRAFQSPVGYGQDGLCEFHNADGTIDEDYVLEQELRHNRFYEDLYTEDD